MKLAPSEVSRDSVHVYGAELMGIEAGLVREGCLADLLLVDGDPVADVRAAYESVPP